MLFNSLDFAVFLPIVFLLYWFITNKNLKLQNFLIVGASYYFYGCWNWKFLSLIFISTFVDYFVGLLLDKENRLIKRKILLAVSIAVNLGFLGFFKYYNFFIENFVTVFTFFGKNINVKSLNIVLPVGISFYTFQTMSYTLDIYKKKIKPTKDFIAFGAYVSFFPQLVAGPIERAAHLLPQFHQKRIFNYFQATSGLKQILWGLFKKIVIADNCAFYVNHIFANYQDLNGSSLVFGAFFFAFQIYGDFSGYSDIAIGTSKLFGFNLMTNFKYPYFSRDIAEFWRRWHISLSTWFRDYVYIPLGGSKGNFFQKIRNTFMIFLVSGFWHGANWTFIVWGGLNAVYFLPFLLLNKNRKHTDIVGENRIFPTIKEIFSMGITFVSVSFAWIFFRAETIGNALEYITIIFSKSLFALPDYHADKTSLVVIVNIFLLLIIEWIGRKENYPIKMFFVSKHFIYRWIFYAFLIFMIIMFYPTTQTPFIYFQF